MGYAYSFQERLKQMSAHTTPYCEDDFDKEDQKISRRDGDCGLYAIVADETPEFATAMHYAARLARLNRGYLAIICVIEMKDFQHWGQIEAQIQRELRLRTETFVWKIADQINTLYQIKPCLYITEGERKDCILDILEKNEEIRMLILAADSNIKGGGPLVSYFSGKGLQKLRVPVLLVPDHSEKT